MKFNLILLALILCCSSLVTAQSTVNIQTRSGGNQLKSVGEGRSIALTNTIMSIATGVATVSFIENNTIQTTGAALAVYGIIVGPSTGNFYAEDYGRGLLGAAGRVAGTYLMVDATREIFGHTFADALGVDDEEVSLTDTRPLIGGGLLVAGMVYNILSIHKSVGAYNAKWEIAMDVTSPGLNKSLAPVVTARYRF